MRRERLSLLSAVLLGLVVGSMFLPWVRTGEAERSSFRLLRDLHKLGVLGGDAATAGRVIWVLVPAFAALALLGFAAGLVRSAAGLAAAVSLIGLCGALVVERTPVVSLSGVYAMFAAAPLSVVVSLLTVSLGRPRVRRELGFNPQPER